MPFIWIICTVGSANKSACSSFEISFMLWNVIHCNIAFGAGSIYILYSFNFKCLSSNEMHSSKKKIKKKFCKKISLLHHNELQKPHHRTVNKVYRICIKTTCFISHRTNHIGSESRSARKKWNEMKLLSKLSVLSYIELQRRTSKKWFEICMKNTCFASHWNSHNGDELRSTRKKRNEMKWNFRQKYLFFFTSSYPNDKCHT